jgi:hypothetical protein
MEITKDHIDKYRERTLEFGYSFFKSKVLLTAVRLDVFNIIGEKGVSICYRKIMINILTQKKEKKYL